MVKGNILGEFPAVLLDLQFRNAPGEGSDPGVEQHTNAALGNELLKLASVAFEQAVESITTVAEHDAVVFGERDGGFGSRIASSDDQDVFVFVLLRAVELVIDTFLFFAGNVQPARGAALAGGQDDAPGPVFGLFADDAEGAVRLPLERLQALLGAHFELIVADDLMPAPDEVFLGGAIEPELAFGRNRVGFGVDPLPFRKIFDRVGNLVLFEHEHAQALVPGGERRVQSGSASADHDEVVPVVAGKSSVGLRRDVLDDVVALLHGQLDDRRAGQVADDVHARDTAFVVRPQCRPALRHVGTFKDRNQFPLQAREHGTLSSVQRRKDARGFGFDARVQLAAAAGTSVRGRMIQRTASRARLRRQGRGKFPQPARDACGRSNGSPPTGE